jgi:hypothetical protein
VTIDRAGRPYLYVTAKHAGLLVLQTADSPRSPTVAAELPTSAFGGMDAMHATQQGEYLYIALGDFFATWGAHAGLAIVSVADPHAPRVVSVWRSARKIKGSATVLVEADHAYLGAMTEGVFMFDIADKGHIRLISTTQPDVHYPRSKPNAIQHPNARGLALRDGNLFVAYDAGGIRVLDVREPARPREIGRYVNAALGNKQQAYNNIVLHGSYLYAAVDYCGLEILDASDPANLRQVGWWNPWSCEARSNNWFNSPGHTNQLVLDNPREWVLMSAGDSELQVVDVSDPRHPFLRASYGSPGNGQGAWGLAAANDWAYLTYIRAFVPFRGQWAGIKALSYAR